MDSDVWVIKDEKVDELQIIKEYVYKLSLIK
jgi:hypothetical protein